MFRLMVLAAQGVFTNAFFLSYLVCASLSLSRSSPLVLVRPRD